MLWEMNPIDWNWVVYLYLDVYVFIYINEIYGDKSDKIVHNLYSKNYKTLLRKQTNKNPSK